MRIVVAVLLLLPCVHAQPAIESIVSGASSVAVPLTGQMLVSIHGRGLAPETAAAEGYPRPRALAGVSVTFNGIAAPLLYVSPQQINAQAPGAIADALEAAVVVHTPDGASDPFAMPAVRTPVPGIFTQDGSGCGQGFIYNVHADGSTSLNTPANSLDPQKDWGLTILATGLGRRDTRADGEAWTFDGSTDQSRFYHTYFGIPGIQNTDWFEPVYSGPMPGSEGVDQINLPLPARLDRIPRGCRVPLWTAFEQRRASRYVSVSVKDGGGACADPATESMGAIELRRLTVIDADGNRSSSASIDARFLRGHNLRLPSGGQGGFSFTTLAYDPPFCAAAFPATFNAGQLSFTGGSFGALSLRPAPNQGVFAYHADLDPGATLEGQVSIEGSGLAGSGIGVVVGRFTASADIPPPIEIATELPPGTSLASPFTLRWTGGDARSIVRVERRVSYPGDDQVAVASSSTLGSTGETTLGFKPIIHPAPVQDAEAVLVVTQSIRDQVPQASDPAADAGLFSAQGLTLGGRVIWKYVWEFHGLTP